MNHLHYNCESGYLPPLKEMERLLLCPEKNLNIRKQQVEITLNDGDLHLYGMAPKEYVDKMAEIVKRDPLETWVGKDLDLLTAAIKEVEAEQNK